MQPNIAICCALAGIILGTSVDIASSGERYSHKSHRHMRIAARTTSHRLSTHATGEAVARTDTSAHEEFQSGIASVYSGERTANGEFASAGGLTAAHRTLPFGTMVRVTNGSTGRSVVVRINDRGPFVRGRVNDLTPAAARAIGSSGLAHVTLAVIHRG